VAVTTTTASIKLLVFLFYACTRTIVMLQTFSCTLTTIMRLLFTHKVTKQNSPSHTIEYVFHRWRVFISMVTAAAMIL